MAWRNSDHEPTLTLPSGATVLQAVFDTLLWAQQAGYCVTLDDDGQLSICPDGLNENAVHIFESNGGDLALILADQTGCGAAAVPGGASGSPGGHAPFATERSS